MGNCCTMPDIALCHGSLTQPLPLTAMPPGQVHTRASPASYLMAGVSGAQAGPGSDHQSHFRSGPSSLATVTVNCPAAEVPDSFADKSERRS